MLATPRRDPERILGGRMRLNGATGGEQLNSASNIGKSGEVMLISKGVARWTGRQPVPCGSRVVLTASPKGCLILYRMGTWRRIRTRLFPYLRTTEKKHRSIRQLARFVISHAEDAEVSPAGKLYISHTLRDFAKLGGLALSIATPSYIEIWSPKELRNAQEMA